MDVNDSVYLSKVSSIAKENNIGIICSYPEKAIIQGETRYYDSIFFCGQDGSILKTYQNCFSIFLLYTQHISKNVKEVSKNEIETFMLKWKTKKDPSASYQNQMINAIKFYYEQVIGKSREMYRIARAKKPKQLPKVISEEEVLKVLKIAKNLKHKSIISLLYSSGLRVSELINLQVSDINFVNHTLHLKGAKGNKDRMVNIGLACEQVLKKYLRTYEPKKICV